MTANQPPQLVRLPDARRLAFAQWITSAEARADGHRLRAPMATGCGPSAGR